MVANNMSRLGLRKKACNRGTIYLLLFILPLFLYIDTTAAAADWLTQYKYYTNNNTNNNDETGEGFILLQ